MPSDEDISLDLAQALGAEAAASLQRLTLYIPDRDREGVELGVQRRYVLEAAELLCRMGGGVTIEPPVEGGWFDPERNVIVWERPVKLYSYVKTESFLELLPELRRFLHRMGRETRQGEVAVEFDGEFYRIHDYEVEEE